MDDELTDDDRWRLQMEARMFALHRGFFALASLSGQRDALVADLARTIEQGRETGSGSVFEEFILEELEGLRGELEELQP
ncbi:hypothetical protein [Vitreimonas sp.]|jgi:hypothetical protein|uniref:hypothetical protein n=1 Tax=Vitreimonas sp. TaxID=3069702 RepID=UPI002ED8FE14